MSRKIRVGIDINEVFRALWLKFDKCYVDEFGEDIFKDEVTGKYEEAKYVYDFFQHYKWSDTEETTQYLNEDVLAEEYDEDGHEIIKDDGKIYSSGLDYVIDKKTGKAPIDDFIMKNETQKLTAKEVYNRFMFLDYMLEIFGAAPVMYRNLEVEVEKFRSKYVDYVDFVLLSKENILSIPSTMFFLSKMGSKFRNIRFVEEGSEMWEGVDVLITTDPEILDDGTPEGKFVIKLDRPYNEECQSGHIKGGILQINDLNGKPAFEELINYPNIKKEEDE